jgi:hypothetical protein
MVAWIRFVSRKEPQRKTAVYHEDIVLWSNSRLLDARFLFCRSPKQLQSPRSAPIARVLGSGIALTSTTPCIAKPNAFDEFGASFHFPNLKSVEGKM